MIKNKWFKIEILAIPLVLLFSILSASLVSIFSKDAKTYLSRGYIYWEKGNYSKALSAINKAIEMKPDFAEAYVARSFIYSKQNDDTHFIDDFLKVGKIDPNYSDEIEIKNENPARYLVRAFFFSRHKRTIPKSSFLGLNLMNDSNNPYNPNNPNGVLEDVSSTEVRVRPLMDAGEDVVRLTVKDDFDKVWAILQQSYDKKGEALADFTKAIQIKPNFAEAYDKRGDFYSGMGEYEKAIADYTKAIEIDPNYVSPYWGRSTTYSKQNKYLEAIADLKKLDQKGMSDKFREMLYGTRGNLYEKQGNYEEAIVDYKKILELKPDDKNRDEMVYFDLGTFYKAEKNYEEAINNFTKSIRIKPNSSSSYPDRATCYYMLNDFDHAWQDVNKAKEMGYNIDPAFLEDLKKASGRQE